MNTENIVNEIFKDAKYLYQDERDRLNKKLNELRAALKKCKNI